VDHAVGRQHRPQHVEEHVNPAHQTAFFQVLDLYWASPESGGMWYKSRQSKKTICSPDHAVGRQHRAQHVEEHVNPAHQTAFFFSSLIFTESRQNLAACGANQGS